MQEWQERGFLALSACRRYSAGTQQGQGNPARLKEDLAGDVQEVWANWGAVDNYIPNLAARVSHQDRGQVPHPSAM
jgi:hypothetical protein